MKKLFVTFTILLFAATAISAQQMVDTRKRIEVKGTAEREIIPDEIYLRIALKEYKDGSMKIDINKLESELVAAVKKIGLPKENLTVENIYGYNWDWKKKKSDEFLATKSFLLKLSDVKQVNNLMGMLDADGVNSSNISQYSHSKIEQYKRELKIEALKNAKEKATYLLSAIDENVGGVLEIQEIDYGNNQPVYQRSNMAYAKESMDGNYQSNLDFKTIKINSEVRAVFEIQ